MRLIICYIKPFVAPEEAACNLIYCLHLGVCQWLSCIVGNVGFKKQSTDLALHLTLLESLWTV